MALASWAICVGTLHDSRLLGHLCGDPAWLSPLGYCKQCVCKREYLSETPLFHSLGCNPGSEMSYPMLIPFLIF